MTKEEIKVLQKKARTVLNKVTRLAGVTIDYKDNHPMFIELGENIMDLKDKSHVGASIILEELLSSSILTYIYFYNIDKDYSDVMFEYTGKDIYAKLEVILNELKKPDFNYEDNLNHKLLMLSSSIYTDLEMDPAYTIELKLFNISVDLQHRISNNLTRMEEQMRKNKEAEKEQK